MKTRPSLPYVVLRAIIRLALGFYFRTIERFHAERVPPSAPVLFTSNHPNSLTDSFVLSSSLRRPVHFVATVQLFRLAPLRWLLLKCGVIPINRAADDPKGMRSVAETFEACYRVLEQGQAVGIFPEGITYDDSQLKEVKTGAARMALELEHRHEGKLGLQIVPVGLTYSAKEKYRSNVLVHFGQPILAADFLRDYSTQRKDCIRRLTSEIETCLRSLIVDLPELEAERLVNAIRGLYLDRLLLGNRVIKEPSTPSEAQKVLLTRAIAEVVRHIQRNDPAQVARFATRLNRYEALLDRLRLSDSSLALLPHPGRMSLRILGMALLAVLGLPVAIYGWVHRALPWWLVCWAERRFVDPGKRKAQRSTAVIAAGGMAFLVFYGLCALVFYQFFGWPAVFWYAASLPVASLLAHYYVVHLEALWRGLHDIWVLLRAPFAARRLVAMRSLMIRQIDQARLRFSPEVLDPKGPS